METSVHRDSVGNPVRGRFNAAVLRALDGEMHRLSGERKAGLFATLPPTLAEIGPGTGANFRYYPRGTTVVAIEPNRYMHPGLRAAADRYGLNLELLAVPAERTGLATSTVDAVVSTLVLCTVHDPRAAVAEAKRILRPGGRLLFLEHVAAPTGSGTGRIQRAAARPWSWCFEGCDTRRDTATVLRDAGFAQVTIEAFRIRSAFLPINEQIAGVAVR